MGRLVPGDSWAVLLGPPSWSRDLSPLPSTTIQNTLRRGWPWEGTGSVEAGTGTLQALPAGTCYVAHPSIFLCDGLSASEYVSSSDLKPIAHSLYTLKTKDSQKKHAWVDGLSWKIYILTNMKTFGDLQLGLAFGSGKDYRNKLNLPTMEWKWEDKFSFAFWGGIPGKATKRTY